MVGQKKGRGGGVKIVCVCFLFLIASQGIFIPFKKTTTIKPASIQCQISWLVLFLHNSASTSSGLKSAAQRNPNVTDELSPGEIMEEGGSIYTGCGDL